MPNVTFISHDGEAVTVPCNDNVSLMRASLQNRLRGIRGACGGAAACGTCHVYVEPDWLARLPEPGPAELNILAIVNNRRPNSRLGCQIRLSPELEGLTVRFPEIQG